MSRAADTINRLRVARPALRGLGARHLSRVRNAIDYVLLNAHQHSVVVDGLDHCNSGAPFDFQGCPSNRLMAAGAARRLVFGAI